MCNQTYFLTDSYFKSEASIKTTIKLKKEIWDQMQIINCGKYRRMGGNWRNTVKEKLLRVFPSCVPTFILNRVKLEKSRKKRSKFWQVKAKCTFTDCNVSYNCYVSKEPKRDRPVKLKVRIDGKVCHKHGETRATKCEGTERMELGQQACQEGPTELFHNKLGEMSSKEFESGNMSSCKTTTVLKKAAFDFREQQRLHSDVLCEMILLREHI